MLYLTASELHVCISLSSRDRDVHFSSVNNICVKYIISYNKYYYDNRFINK